MVDQKQKVQTALECWYLTGATASGKTSVSIQLAKKLDAEIISLDSMAIYREMDIGTAKPPISQRQNIPHHLIDICNPSETFSVSQYRDMAIDTIVDAKKRGKQVLVVGGTALYLKALLRGMFDGPPADWDFRNQIQEDIEKFGSELIHKRLEAIDPISAHNLHPNDHRRIIRALEVFKMTGQPISHLQKEFDQGMPAEECKVFTLRHPRPVLHQRIEERVDQMFESGLVDEVNELLENWDNLSHTALQAVGYKEAIGHVQKQIGLNDAIEQVKIRTRRFARHQETWFRGLSECQIIDLDAGFEPESIAERLLEIGSGRTMNRE